MIITFPQRGNIKIQAKFQSDEFKSKLEKDVYNMRKQKNLNEIHKDAIIGACKLSKNKLEPRVNRKKGQGLGGKEGICHMILQQTG